MGLHHQQQQVASPVRIIPWSWKKIIQIILKSWKKCLLNLHFFFFLVFPFTLWQAKQYAVFFLVLYTFLMGFVFLSYLYTLDISGSNKAPADDVIILHKSSVVKYRDSSFDDGKLLVKISFPNLESLLLSWSITNQWGQGRWVDLAYNSDQGFLSKLPPIVLVVVSFQFVPFVSTH